MILSFVSVNDEERFQSLIGHIVRFINITKAGGVEEEFIKISKKHNVNITLGFNESIADFDKVASSSFSCENIKCLNSNLKKNNLSLNNRYCCAHRCADA